MIFAWANFPYSPLKRHPSLLLRKVWQRFCGPAKFSLEAAPTQLRYQSPSGLAAGLREWLGSIHLRQEPHPYGRVFHQDFDEGELLQMSGTGPKHAADLTGDIKLIWEFSRGYAVSLNAARYFAHPTPAEIQPIARHVKAWLEANQEPSGINWQCAMEVAIRATNWISADALLSGELRRAVGESQWDRWLWLHGYAIWTNREARLISSNHYVANVLGLLFIGRSFPDDPVAQRWLQWARREMPHVLMTQTHDDGGLYEASLPYHALVTEMALLYLLLEHVRVDPAARQKIRTMCQVVCDMLDVDGDVFRIGDDDGGRVIPFDFISRTMGRGQILLALAATLFRDSAWSQDSRLYPQSGWWIARRGPFTALLEFGGVGMKGLGAHAHNDTLSLSVNYGDRRLFADPGSGIYTPDPELRNSLRSTMAHATLTVDHVEQAPLVDRTLNDLFRLRGSDRGARVINSSENEISAETPARYAITHRRTVRMGKTGLVIEDSIVGTGTHALTWHFPLAPDIEAAEKNKSVALKLNKNKSLDFSCDQDSIQLMVKPSLYSPFYGSHVASRTLHAEMTCTLPVVVTWKLR